MSNNILHVPSDDDFVEEWLNFFNAINDVWLSKAKSDNSRYELLIAPFNNIISCICSEEARNDVRKGIKYLKIEFEDNAKVIIFSLYAEMKYVIELCKNNDVKTDDALSSGKNVKDSLEKIFKLPEWLKKILHILNELLSLIKS